MPDMFRDHYTLMCARYYINSVHSTSTLRSYISTSLTPSITERIESTAVLFEAEYGKAYLDFDTAHNKLN